MTVQTTVVPLSIRDILFDPMSGADTMWVELVNAVRHAAAENADLATLVFAQRHVDPDLVLSAAARALATTLSRSAPDLIVGGFLKVRDLVQAGQVTATNPDETIVVPLGSYVVTHDETQTLLISAGPLKATMPCRLELVFDLEPVCATVAGGRVVQLGDARCKIHVTLHVANHEVASRSRTVSLRAHLGLDPGIPLVALERTAESGSMDYRPRRPRTSTAASVCGGSLCT